MPSRFELSPGDHIFENTLVVDPLVTEFKSGTPCKCPTQFRIVVAYERWKQSTRLQSNWPDEQTETATECSAHFH